MKFSLTWLKDHLETDASLSEITEALNAIGLEVEGAEDPAERLAGFRVAKVVSAAKHPDADKLQVLEVDTGEGGTLQVVCGAPNARAGMKGVLGLPGAVVPANGMELRKSAIRGVESNGMMCSLSELELGDNHDGIVELPQDAPIGEAFADYHGAAPIIDVAITPNRPDCMGVYGIARDLAAAGLGRLKPLTIPQLSTSDLSDPSDPCPIEIRTDDADGCPAFYGRVIKGVKNGSSPEWMQQRLISAGQRPISALVDITNYVMLTFGRPAHAYDLSKLEGAMVARRAQNGEEVLALNEKTYKLDESMMVIADDAGVHDIAGIMGGEHSGCTEDTSDVLLEIAYFDPGRIGVTGRKLGLASDARTRFERGVDPEFLHDGLEIISGLVIDICGGKASEAIHAGTPPNTPKEVEFDTTLTARLGGVDVPLSQQQQILEALGFKVSSDWHVTCPLRRHDIEGAADLVEEIVRIYGLDKVESVALPRDEGVAKPTASPQQALERKLRRGAAARGLDEAITWSFLPVAQAEYFAPEGSDLWLLANPISEDMKAMRPSLIPGLLTAAKRNAMRGHSSTKLFELGRRYFRNDKGLSDERATLGVILAGEKQERNWAGGKAIGFDAFDAKSVAIAMLEMAGAPVQKLMVMDPIVDGSGTQFHPGQSATLRLGPKKVLARFGMLHPTILNAFDVAGPVAAVEVFLDALPPKKTNSSFARASFAPPALQSVTRDFAFLVPAELAAGELHRAVQNADKSNITSARIFDVFTGDGVPDGKKSIALEVTFQPQDKSYKESELKAISDKIVAAAAKQGAELRG